MAAEHLFVIDPLPTLNPALDSSLRMMHALAALGHGIAVCEQRDLSWRSGEATATARCQQLRFGNAPTEYKAEAHQARSLGSFAAVHMRKDPPYDMDYVGTTWLLEGAGRGAGKAIPKVYNDPEALRRFNEKLTILRFPQETKPALLSADPAAIERFVDEVAHGDGILKPLTLFGGRGVERLQVSALGRDGLRAKLRAETENGTRPRLVQPFDPAVFAGEVRAFTAFGEPLAWCLKRPADGNFLANTRAGANLEPYSPTPVELERVTRVAKDLLVGGVAMIGFDLIGGFVSEVNITSPRLLLGASDGPNPYKRWAELVSRDLIV